MPQITVKIHGYHPEGTYLIVSGHGLRDVEWGMFICNADQLTRLDDSTSVWFPKNGLIGFID